jgi:hypothetical protein
MPSRDLLSAERCNVLGASHIAAIDELRKVAAKLRIFGESALMVDQVRVRRGSPEARANQSVFSPPTITAIDSRQRSSVTPARHRPTLPARAST